MYVSTKDWRAFVSKLSRINTTAADAVKKWVAQNGFANTNALIAYAYEVADYYGTASASLAALMYDSISELEQTMYPPAELAPNPSYEDVAEAVNGTLKTSQNANMIGSAVGRLVKRTGQDTLLNNAVRDGAQWAWIPSGDTCAFCITLASRGWQRASASALKGGHAEHIHANCDCTYMIRHSDSLNVRGYDPDAYKRMYYDAPGGSSRSKINAMRRQMYKEHKDEINAQKREAYAMRNGLTGGSSETYMNKYGKQVTFVREDSDNAKLIKSLLSEYDSRLSSVEAGAAKAAGDVDITGATMRLSTKDPAAVMHEFAHTLANTSADKYGLTKDADFWKEIRKVRRQYLKAVGDDTGRWISSYEHGQTGLGALDEFMAESFAQIKAKERGVKLSGKYGNDTAFSKQVVDIIDKYFKKKHKQN